MKCRGSTGLGGTNRVDGGEVLPASPPSKFSKALPLFEWVEISDIRAISPVASAIYFHLGGLELHPEPVKQ